MKIEIVYDKETQGALDELDRQIKTASDCARALDEFDTGQDNGALASCFRDLDALHRQKESIVESAIPDLIIVKLESQKSHLIFKPQIWKIF